MIRDLGDGLVLRASTAVDAEALAAFVGDVLRAQDSEEPNHGLAAWTRDLHEGRHPTFRPGDCTIVAEAASGVIVSCLHLIPQTWTYGGVPIAVGQPELIGTRPEHRGRHLVRAQFDVVHGWSAARGHQLQIISGIPWFYRQFGYELALERGGGPLARRDLMQTPPPVPAGWRVRHATADDAVFLADLSATAAARSLVSVPRDAALWRYELTGRSERSAQRREARVLERDGRPVGYVTNGRELFSSGSLVVTSFEVMDGVSWREGWLAALPPLFEAGDALAEALPARRCPALSFWLLGREHPLYRVFPFKERDDHYALYVRVPDVASFLRAVTPALERRLAVSVCAGHTGTLTLGFYRSGVRLALERGKVTALESWTPDLGVRGLEYGRPSTDARRPLAMFPDLTFLQLLFGFRSLAELEAAFPDCIVRTNEARALLDALFPRTPSDVWPLV